MMRISRLGWLAVVAGGMAWGQAPVERAGGVIDLPTSKQIVGVVPGGPQQLTSLPVSMAVSPDGKWVVTVNGGYGSFEGGYMQGLAVLNVATGALKDYPDARTLSDTHQILFSGLAFSADGKHVYASLASETDPEGLKAGSTGSGVAVYSFVDGVIAAERVIKIPLQALAAGRGTRLIGGKDGSVGLPYPAAIAVIGAGVGGELKRGGGVKTQVSGARPGAPRSAGGELLLVADNLSDDVVLMDAATGAVVTRFDLAESNAVPSVYPVALAVSKDGRRGFVALWNGSEVVELDLVKGTVGRKLALLKPGASTAAGSHPDALALSPDGNTLYCALGNRDAVAAVGVGKGEFGLKGYFDTRLPGQSFYGAEPESLAVSEDGRRVYVANMGSDAVAVLDATKLTKKMAGKGFVEPLGFVPTEWLPLGVSYSGGKLFVATGKGTGTGPNNFAQRATEATKGQPRMKRDFTYIATLLHGSVAEMDAAAVEAQLKESTGVVLESNRLKAGAERIVFSGLGEMRHAGPSTSLRSAQDDSVGSGARGVGGSSTQVSEARPGAPTSLPLPAGPIKHVIYIIKENRTYDQIFGDLPVGNGDKSLTMYGEEVTPNQHKLAMQFGVLDNFYDSAEVSGDGHVWSNTAIGTDYLERTWQLNYRGREHGYDFEGVVSEGLPLAQNIPDVNEPGTGYIWGNLAKHGKSLYHFGEFISSTFCKEKGLSGAEEDPQLGPLRGGATCAQRASVAPGEALPVEWGGGVNKWPWAIPLLASNVATKPELVGHYALEAPDFNLRVPDQVRVDIFLKHLEGWVADKKAGKDTLPNFVMLRLANDHTAGTTAGGPTPRSSVADNDLAVGRAVEAISNSPYWNDTAFFILEDDAQNGADHVDAHRSIGLVVSKYAPQAPAGKAAFVDSRFYSTVSMVRTMETLLGLPPMNNNDALSSMMGSLFTGKGDQAAFAADYRNRDNGLIYTANAKTATGAKESAKMDFTHADRADARKLNVILWQDAMGSTPVPAMLTEKRKKANDGDD